MNDILTREFDRDELSVTEAREAISNVIRHLPRARQMAIRVLTSETISNEVLHGEDDGPITLRVKGNLERFRIEVEAEGVGFAPTPQMPSLTAESGRGLLLLTRLANEFGVRKHGSLVTVWFEVLSAEDVEDPEGEAFSGYLAEIVETSPWVSVEVAPSVAPDEPAATSAS